ncbi:MAG TPA: HAD family phosphatase [Bacillus bacterium]|nr:HAD family phosphatase [Bacillus sp. (in: firmicutes)]
MKPHLIAVDLDGTLLKNNKTISKRTLDTIKHVRERGHQVMIATGRPFRASQFYYKQMKLNTPIVNYNGAYIHHPKDEAWGTYHSPLALNVAQQIIDTCNKYNIRNIMAQVKDHIFLQNHDEDIMELLRFGNPQIHTGQVRENLKSDPTSILIHSKEDELDSIRKQLSQEVGSFIEHRSSGSPWNIIEIIRAGINKAIGVKQVAESFQIPEERIIAFGDEDNDIEMLQLAKYGVAMGNAIDDVKSVAYDVTNTNEEDGIAYYLEKFFRL